MSHVHPRATLLSVQLMKRPMSLGRKKTATIPTYLMDAHYKGASKLGHGLGYQYAHNFENHYVKQQYLPDEIKDSGLLYSLG